MSGPPCTHSGLNSMHLAKQSPLLTSVHMMWKCGDMSARPHSRSASACSSKSVSHVGALAFAHGIFDQAEAVLSEGPAGPWLMSLVSRGRSSKSFQ